jgi:hypothetical protein
MLLNMNISPANNNKNLRGMTEKKNCCLCDSFSFFLNPLYWQFSKKKRKIWFYETNTVRISIRKTIWNIVVVRISVICVNVWFVIILFFSSHISNRKNTIFLFVFYENREENFCFFFLWKIILVVVFLLAGFGGGVVGDGVECLSVN